MAQHASSTDLGCARLPPVNEVTRTEARVVVLTRQQCHLCDEALAIIDRVCAEAGASYTEVDVDSDPQLRQQYTDQVPVTFVDGQQHDFWRVSEPRLRAALQPAR